VPQVGGSINDGNSHSRIAERSNPPPDRPHVVTPRCFRRRGTRVEFAVACTVTANVEAPRIFSANRSLRIHAEPAGHCRILEPSCLRNAVSVRAIFICDVTSTVVVTDKSRAGYCLNSNTAVESIQSS
jgi:hypothetical protein